MFKILPLVKSQSTVSVWQSSPVFEDSGYEGQRLRTFLLSPLPPAPPRWHLTPRAHSLPGPAPGTGWSHPKASHGMIGWGGVTES